MPGAEIVRLLDPRPVPAAGQERLIDGPAERTLWSVIDDRLRGRWPRAIALGAVLGAALGAAGYLCSAPSYESIGLIRVAPAISPILRQTPETEVLPLYDYFLGTQMRLIESRPVLERALRDEALSSLPWTREPGALARLERRLVTEASYGSELITVKFSADDPETARAAVNAVIDAYDELYGSSGRTEVHQKLSTLKERRDELRHLRAEKRNEIQEFVSSHEYGAPDFEVLVSDQTSRLGELEKAVDRLERMLDVSVAMESRSGGAGDGAAGPGAEELADGDPELARLLELHHALCSSLELARWRPGHPMLARLQEQARTVEKLVDRRAALQRSRVAGTAIVEVGAPGEPPRTREQVIAELEALTRSAAMARARLRQIGADRNRLDELQAALSDIEQDLGEVGERIKSLEIEGESVGSGRISIAAYGDRPGLPSRDRRLPLAAAGGLGGLALSFGLYFLLGTVDRRTYEAQQLRHRGRPPCVGVLPELGRGALDPEACSVLAHCAHQIRNRIEAGRDPKSSLVLAVTSPSEGDGKTSVAVALGWSFAAGGNRTLLIDCDMVAQRLTRQMGGLGHPGVKEALRSPGSGGGVVALPVHNLSLLPVGLDPGFGAEAVRKDALAAVLDRLRGAFDVIIVDTGPMPGSLEGLPVVASADKVLVVRRRGRPRAQLEECLDFLAASGAGCAGVVLNCAGRADTSRSVSKSSVSAAAPGNGRSTGTAARGEPDLFLRAMRAAAAGPAPQSRMNDVPAAPGGSR